MVSGYAFFVHLPRTIRDLRRPHLAQASRAFEVVQTITLDALDYENFTEDLLVDRQFIEAYEHLCFEDDCFHCLWIKHPWKNEGILVMPEMLCYVKCAAYIQWEEEA